MTFFSITYLPPRSTPSKTNCKLKSLFKLVLQENGSKVLVKDGETNLHDEIQMFKDECNIYNIIRRYELGDVGALSRVSSAYVDTLGQPKTMQEALNLSLKLRSNFDSFKPEVQAEFGNDFNKFLSSVADGTVVDVLKKFNVAEPSAPKEDTHES